MSRIRFNPVKFLNKSLRPLMLSQFGKPLRKICPPLRAWCPVFPNRINILSDGHVTTCCRDWKAENAFGSLYTQDIGELWQGPIKKIVEQGDLWDLKRCQGCIGRRVGILVSRPKSIKHWLDIMNKPFPPTIQIEVMARCNYSCCGIEKLAQHRKFLKADLHKTFSQIKPALKKIDRLILFNGGESLLHEGFPAFIEKCRAEAPHLEMLLSTNGMLMSEEVSQCFVEQQVNEVVVSIHGGPGTENMLKYSKCGANYEEVMANIQQLVEMRNKRNAKKPRVKIKTILFEWNDTDELMDQLRADARKVGADHLYWVLDWERGELDRSSKRFTPQSADLARLIDQGEFGVF